MLQIISRLIVRCCVVFCFFCAACSATEPQSESQSESVQVWSGTLAAGEEMQRIRMEIRDRGGSVTGFVHVEAPETHEMLSAGTVSGARRGKTAEWRIATGSVNGTFVNDTKFEGTVNFEDQGWGALTAQLQMTRVE